MGGRRLREDIPLNLTGDYKQEALMLRNKLLSFRLRNVMNHELDATMQDRSIEPRLSQVFAPLLSVIKDPKTREVVRQVARAYHEELVADRGLDTEAHVLEIIHDLKESPYTEALSVKEIAELFRARYEDDYERKITPHWVGYLLRRKLGLKTEKRHGIYIIGPSEGPKLERLFEKYGINRPTAATGDLGDSGDFTGEMQEPKAPINSSE